MKLFIPIFVLIRLITIVGIVLVLVLLVFFIFRVLVFIVLITIIVTIIIIIASFLTAVAIAAIVSGGPATVCVQLGVSGPPIMGFISADTTIIIVRNPVHGRVSCSQPLTGQGNRAWSA